MIGRDLGPKEGRATHRGGTVTDDGWTVCLITV